MKVLKRVLREGKIVLKVETLDDLWHLYNIVVPGDVVISRTTRRVRIGGDDARKQESIRKPMTLVLRVEDVSFHTFSNRVRIQGVILEGPSDLVSMGSHHTFNIEPGNTLTVLKKHWPEYALQRLRDAEKSQMRPMCLIVTIEDGVAELFLAADYGLKQVVRVRIGISRKRGDQKTHDASMRDFFGNVMQALQAQLGQNEIGLLIIAGPGFVKDHFAEFLKKASIKGLPPLVVEGTNAIGIPGAKEILARGVISRVVKGLKVETETRLVEELIAHIAKGNGLGTYGDEEVARAVQYGAVRDLLVTDTRLREGNDIERRKMDRLIRNTEKTRGSIHIVSTDHPAGDQLQGLGGIAAILRFPLER